MLSGLIQKIKLNEIAHVFPKIPSWKVQSIPVGPIAYENLLSPSYIPTAYIKNRFPSS